VHFCHEETGWRADYCPGQIAVGPDDSAETLAQKVQAKSILYPIVVALVAVKDPRATGGCNKVLFDGKRFHQPLVLRQTNRPNAVL